MIRVGEWGETRLKLAYIVYSISKHPWNTRNTVNFTMNSTTILSTYTEYERKNYDVILTSLLTNSLPTLRTPSPHPYIIGVSSVDTLTIRALNGASIMHIARVTEDGTPHV